MIQRGPYRIHKFTIWTTIFLTFLGLYIYLPPSWVDLNILAWRGRMIRILAFGDSLTEGLHSWPLAPQFHPYSRKLEHLLNEHSRSTNGSFYFLIHNEGKSGDRASLRMFSRLKSLLNNSRIKYDVAVILAGTNDLVDVLKGNRRNFTIESITNHIKYMHELCHQHDITTIAMTIPETGHEKQPVFRNISIFREAINNNIREYSEQNPTRVFLFDLATAIPRPTGDNRTLEHLWDDGLHFTKEGYDRLAVELFLYLKTQINTVLFPG